MCYAHACLSELRMSGLCQIGRRTLRLVGGLEIKAGSYINSNVSYYITDTLD